MRLLIEKGEMIGLVKLYNPTRLVSLRSNNLSINQASIPIIKPFEP